MKLDNDTAELVALYAEESPHARNVIAAFVVAGEEPPHSIALTAKQSNVVQAFYASHDPNGSQAEWAKLPA